MKAVNRLNFKKHINLNLLYLIKLNINLVIKFTPFNLFGVCMVTLIRYNHTTAEHLGMIDRIDMVPDIPDTRMLLLTLAEHLDIRPLQSTRGSNKGLFFAVRGLNGIRFQVKRLDEIGLHQSMEEMASIPRDHFSLFFISRVIINPCQFTDLYELWYVFNEIFQDFRPDDAGIRWPFRIQRIELAVDIPMNPEIAQVSVQVGRSETRHYQMNSIAGVQETVYGNPPSSLAIYNRRSALQRMRQEVPSGHLTRFERRYTKPSSWGNPNYFPNREIQSIEWLINMCADIEEDILVPFEGVVIRNFNPHPPTPDLNALRRSVLRAELRKPARTDAMNQYTESHAEFIQLATIARQYGFMEAQRYIISRYGRNHAFPYSGPTDRHYRELLNSFFPENSEFNLGNMLKASIRQHHFNNVAPRRVYIAPVPSRGWANDGNNIY